ncbi:SGNH/GDSL hydrolase family protein [Roseomonas sp. SSH11]|uniref:SGNH/GDSL hydrolase family protein n=1 Tax=Pararoseomonas baculiformis TaxID=2820812 RepID=A0ABS4AEN9_9PROT|nr:SGNH/GDSL hydrolase family protein [Pararoseomonas baculiformis]MBP0445487.1 SGNH/GDSL hydrolase family protein [Pararoseomonas baculiformis]
MPRPAARFALLIALLLAAAPGQATPCGAPDDLIEPVPLPATAAAIKAGALPVLVVGSASVAGPGSSGSESAYPTQLEHMLARTFPGTRVEVMAQGGRGMTATDHLSIIRAALRQRPRALVLWQAATVEAVRGADIGEMTNALQDGAERIRAAGGDLIFLDPQWSRFLRANADVEAYRDALRAAAAATGAGLLSRYELMGAWAEAGTVDVERAPRELKVVEVDKLNRCLAESLTEMIAGGVREARP